MANPNRISIDIPQQVITDVINSLTAIRNSLQPYLQSLTVDDRQTLPKMSNKTVSFVNKIKDYVDTNPEFAPSFLDVPELRKDIAAVNALKPLNDICEQLASNLNDTIMLLGSEAYQASLIYYANVKLASHTGQANAKPVYEDLSERFPGTRKVKQVPNP